MHKIAENVYLEVGSGEPIESENLVEFHLLYGGPLHSGGHDNPREEKHSIRRVFHSQLKRLWQTHPNLRRMAQMGGSTIVIKGDAVNTDFRVMFANKPIPERNNMLVQLGLKELGEKWSRGKYKFVPLVTEELCLRCSLEILFLRAEEQNYILQSGDIDGRLKALFDALRIAESGELPPKASPTGVSILLCKRPGFVFGDGVPGKGVVPLPWPSAIEAIRGFIGQFSLGPACALARES